MNRPNFIQQFKILTDNGKIVRYEKGIYIIPDGFQAKDNASLFRLKLDFYMTILNWFSSSIKLCKKFCQEFNLAISRFRFQFNDRRLFSSFLSLW